MSPSKFYDDKREMMNGAHQQHHQRQTALKINKESHFIQKSSSQSSSSNSSSSFTGIATATATAAATKQQHQHQHHQQRHPVIIYTHSPKIIHTNVHNFMSLVQKLTGLSHSEEDESVQQPPAQGQSGRVGNNNKMNGGAGNDDTTSSSVVTDENCGGVTDVHVNSSSVSPAFDPNNSYLSDIPLFTPNSSEFFSSSRPYYRFPDPMYPPTNMGSSINPSVLEFLKGFPDYCNSG